MIILPKHAEDIINYAYVIYQTFKYVSNLFAK